jgi:hypothetical protein
MANPDLLSQVLTALAFVYNNLQEATAGIIPDNVIDETKSMINELGQALSLALLISGLQSGGMLEDCEHCPAVEECDLPSAVKYRAERDGNDGQAKPATNELSDNDIRGLFGLSSSDQPIDNNPDNQ